MFKEIDMFSERLKATRLERGYTLKVLGRRIGMAESTVSLYESGKREPDLETIQRIADVFGVTTDYLLGRTDDPTPADEKKGSLDEQLSGIEFALFGEIRELDDEDKLDILNDVRRARELRELRKLKKALENAQGDASDEVRKKDSGN